MSYRGEAMSGFAGHHRTLADLELVRPADDNVGRIATVGTPETTAVYHISQGNGWEPLVTAQTNNVTGRSKFSSVVDLSAVPKLCTLGNSLTALGGPAVTSALNPQNDWGWPAWAQGFLGPRLLFVKNAAVSGATTQDLIDAVDAGEVPDDCDWVSVMEFRNSMVPLPTGGGKTVAEAIAEMEVLIGKLMARNPNRRLVLMTHPTGAGIPSGWTGTLTEWNSQIMACNQWLRVKVLSVPGAVLVDAEAVCIDPTSATLSPKANYVRADNVHLTPKGSRWVGKGFADATSPFLPKTNIWVPTVNAYNKVTIPASASKIINSNPLFQGSGGTATGSTGTVALSCAAGIAAGSATCANTVVARADGFGNDQILTITGASADCVGFVRGANNESAPYFTNGDYLYSMCNISLTGQSGVKGVELAQYLQAGPLYQNFGMHSQATSVAEWDQTDLTDFWIFTPISQYNYTPTVVYSRVNLNFGAAAGTAVLKVGRMPTVNLGNPWTL